MPHDTAAAPGLRNVDSQAPERTPAGSARSRPAPPARRAAQERGQLVERPLESAASHAAPRPADLAVLGCDHALAERRDFCKHMKEDSV